MKPKLLRSLAAASLTAFLLIAGCGDSSAPVVSEPEQEPTEVASYFPLSAGKILEFSVSNEITDSESRERYTIGAAVTDGSQTSYQWIHINLDYPNRADTGYFVQTDDALYYYEEANGDAQVVLTSPFKVGKSWNRQSRSRVGQNLIDSLSSIDNRYGDQGNEEIKEDYNEEITDTDSDTFGGAGKNFPLLASSYMEITAIEDLTLSSGQIFEDCIKVEGISGSGYKDIYWYAPDYGMVKYIIGATEQSLTASETPDGTVIGELIRH